MEAGDPEEHAKKLPAHKESGKCKCNFEGSSGAMEVEGALKMWNRSIQKHNLRYSFMVSDGDSKAFKAVSESQCYGENFTIEKMDCVGHVQKRMGKRLSNLKSITKGKLQDGKTIGGKGRLTDVTIKRIQRYYGLAIRQNTCKSANPSEDERKLSVYQMKKNIMAILSHTVTRENPATQHSYCPTGPESWCAWQRDFASGTSTYDPKHCLPAVFMDLLRPTFTELSADNLLSRCVVGATQNQNESINSLVTVSEAQIQWVKYCSVCCCFSSYTV